MNARTLQKFGLLSATALLMVMGSHGAKAADCVANASTLKSAQYYFQKKCGVRYNTKLGHTCIKKSNGAYRCLTGSNNSVSETNSKVNTAPKSVTQISSDKGYTPTSGKCSVKWSPASSQLASSSWGSGSYIGGKSRVSYNAATKSMAIKQTTQSRQLSEHRPGSPWVRGNTARLSVDLYIPSNYNPDKDNRFAIGIRGGANVNQKFISGGGKNAGKSQDGWSVRINYNSSLVPSIYSYHLNRAGNGNYGTGIKLNKSVPKGQWVTMVLDIGLNTIGKTNGFAKLSMHNSNGSVISSGTFSNLKFRNLASWDNFGIIMTDKNEHGAKSPASILYRNYKLSVGNGGSC